MEAPPRPLEFRGSGREYFGIWIVNLLLSLVTLGIYIPWARVRTRRYFHRNTFLDGHGFDYVADPKRLLIGYVIVGIFFIAYLAAPQINPLWSIPILLLFWAVFPWLRYKSMRFFAANSTYRGVRFRFLGACGRAYAVFLGFPILSALSLGILWPWTAFQEKQYHFGNFAFGNFRSEFRGTVGWFYKVLLILFGSFIVAMVLWMALIAVVVAATVHVEKSGAGKDVDLPPAFYVFVTVFYLVIFLFPMIWRVLSLNYCWNHTVAQPGGQELTFASRMRAGRYLWIVFSNVFLILVTLGIFLPFAAVRAYRYRVTCMSVGGTASLDDVVTVAGEESNAIGDTAADLFDFEFGL